MPSGLVIARQNEQNCEPTMIAWLQFGHAIMPAENGAPIGGWPIGGWPIGGATGGAQPGGIDCAIAAGGGAGGGASWRSGAFTQPVVEQPPLPSQQRWWCSFSQAVHTAASSPSWSA